MIPTTFRTLSVLLLVCFSAAASAEPSAVRTMMEASGMIEQFADAGESWRDQVLRSRESSGGMPPEIAAEFADIVGDAMDGRRLIADIEAALTESVTEEDAAAVTEFYTSPFGERVRAAEVATSTPEARREIEMRVAELRKELDDDPARLAFFQRIDKALMASELSATALSGMMRSMIIGMIVSQNQEPTPELVAAIEARAIGPYAALVEQTRDYILASSQRTYRDFSNEELEDYARFLESPEGLAVYAGLNAAMREIMEGRGREIGGRFGALMRQKRT